MNEQELSPIEQYRAMWKPNQARIAELNAAFDAAKLAGDAALMRALIDELWYAMRPPRHLPIKTLNETPQPQQMMDNEK
jgi:hypothetical protein